MDQSLFCQSNLLYTQESLSRYCPGGYHPVNLGDTFENGRYKIYHKLGWGGYSTVWLAMDNSRSQWVSIKILTANSPISRELRILDILQTRGGLSSNYIVQLLDTFTHTGPNGAHQCLVFELLGPSMAQVLADYRSDGDKFEPEILLRISKQLLKAVDFIHSSGLCHGDISARNIAFTCKSISRGTEDELFEILGFPEHEPLSRIDGAPLEVGLPKHLVKAAEWDEWIEEEEEDIRILDFGESFFQGQEPEKLAQPGSHRVPETIFTDSFGYRVDLWRTGCMIYSFVFAAWPFWYLGDDEVLVHQMIGLVGKLPDEWEAKWESVLKGSKHDLGPDGDSGGTKLEQRLDELETTLKPLCDVIQGLMRFQPARRIAAGDALDMLGHG